MFSRILKVRKFKVVEVGGFFLEHKILRGILRCGTIQKYSVPLNNWSLQKKKASQENISTFSRFILVPTSDYSCEIIIYLSLSLSLW